MDDSENDGVLVVLTPQDMTDPTQTAEAVKTLPKHPGKPILASWMGGAEVAAGRVILNRLGIPTFQFPDAAARAFTYMFRYAYNLRALYETPTLTDDFHAKADRIAASQTEALPRGSVVAFLAHAPVIVAAMPNRY